MKPLEVGAQTALLSQTAAGQGRLMSLKSTSGSLFDLLLERLGQSTGQQVPPPVAKANGDSGSASIRSTAEQTGQGLLHIDQQQPINHPLEQPLRPIERLEQALVASGHDPKSLVLPAEAKERLTAVLQKSGYSEAQIKQVLSKATLSDGRINLGRLFAALKTIKAEKGPELTISRDDMPLLIQFLTDLGLNQEQVNNLAGRCGR